MQSIKLVTFDATNTLLKFRTPPWHHYTMVARDYGFKGTPDEVRKKLLDSYSLMWKKYPNFGKSQVSWDHWWREVVKKTFDGQLPGEKNVNIIANQLIEEFKTKKCWYLDDGGRNLLKILEKRGLQLGIISNFDPRLNDILNNLEIAEKFNFVVTSYETGFSKPDTRIFDCALEKAGRVVGPLEALHIGDDVKKDYLGAKAAGWHALLVTSNKESIEKPPALNHVFNNLQDVCVAIENEQLAL